MINEDTIYLLRECNAGTQMAVYSIGEILENVKDQKLREILISSKNHHEQLGNELHILLQNFRVIISLHLFQRPFQHIFAQTQIIFAEHCIGCIRENIL